MPETSGRWAGTNVTSLSPDEHRQHLRMLEALIFAAAEPLSETELAARLPAGLNIGALLGELQVAYAGRGVNLRRSEDRWAFRTAEDMAELLRFEAREQRKLSRAALETLAIVAYHQPVTRAEIEEIRGVSVSRGTLDVLLEAGWIRLRGRRRSPGRPVTFGTTAGFLDHFGLDSVATLPGIAELKAAGLLDASLAVGEDAAPVDDLASDEDPIEADGEPAAF